MMIELDIVAVALLVYCLASRTCRQGSPRQIEPASAPIDAAGTYCNDRRHQLLLGLEELHRVVTSLGDNASSKQESAQTSCKPRRAGARDYHAVSAEKFLLPVEVAAWQFDPDTSEHVQRLLKDRWAVAYSSLACIRLPSPCGMSGNNYSTTPSISLLPMATFPFTKFNRSGTNYR